MAQAPESTDADRYKLIDNRRDNTDEFDSWEAAQEAKDDMVGLGANPQDFEIQPVNSANGQSDDTQAPAVVDDTEPAKDDAQDRQEQKATDDQHSAIEKDTITEPERSVTDDPIAWLNRNANDFVDTIQGTQAINKKGFRVLQHFYDISVASTVEIAPEDTDFEYCRVKATAEMPDGRTAEAHGSAHVDREDDHYLLLEMADTRAKSRVLSDITGVGAVAVAELKDDATN